jgi:hypothetical protein
MRLEFARWHRRRSRETVDARRSIDGHDLDDVDAVLSRASFDTGGLDRAKLR